MQHDGSSDNFYICREHPSNQIDLKIDGSSGKVTIQNGLYISDSVFEVLALPGGNYADVRWNSTNKQFYIATSSRRYKENIQPLEDRFERLHEAEPMMFTRPENPDRWEIGYIAEDFDALGLDKLVFYDDQGRPEGIFYEQITLYLTEIAKTQQREIADLSERNAALEDRLAQLEARVAQLVTKIEKE